MILGNCFGNSQTQSAALGGSITRAGGFHTHYTAADPLGGMVSDTNTETTSLAVLGLTALLRWLTGARVLLLSGQEHKRERAAQLGADATANYHTLPDWDRWVREQTEGQGADIVLEVGGAGTLERSLRAVRRGGYIALIGVLAGRGTIDPMPILMKAVRLQGIFVGSRKMFEDMLAFLQQHRLRPVIDRRFPLPELPAALEAMRRGLHFGKIVLDIIPGVPG